MAEKEGSRGWLLLTDVLLDLVAVALAVCVMGAMAWSCLP